jgi:hypothetical protein
LQPHNTFVVLITKKRKNRRRIFLFFVDILRNFPVNNKKCTIRPETWGILAFVLVGFNVRPYGSSKEEAAEKCLTFSKTPVNNKQGRPAIQGLLESLSHQSKNL